MSAPLAISRHICETIPSTPMSHTHTHTHTSPFSPTQKHQPTHHTHPHTKHRPNAQPHGKSAHLTKLCRCNWRWYCRPLSPSRHPQACLPLLPVGATQGTGDVSTSRDQQTHMRNHTIDSHVAHTHTHSTPLPSPPPRSTNQPPHPPTHQTPAQWPNHTGRVHL